MDVSGRRLLTEKELIGAEDGMAELGPCPGPRFWMSASILTTCIEKSDGGFCGRGIRRAVYGQQKKTVNASAFIAGFFLRQAFRQPLGLEFDHRGVHEKKRLRGHRRFSAGASDLVGMGEIKN